MIMEARTVAIDGPSSLYLSAWLYFSINTKNFLGSPVMRVT